MVVCRLYQGFPINGITNIERIAIEKGTDGPLFYLFHFGIYASTAPSTNTETWLLSTSTKPLVIW
jgi:hypothetical protein